MPSEILPIPPLPKQILEAVNNNRLAVFIGAGVSRLIGCKGWDELAKTLIKRCYTTRKPDGSTLINFKEMESLSLITDHKRTITICRRILGEDSFLEELRRSLEADPRLVETQNIYAELWRLRGLYITTNADVHFDAVFEPRNVLSRPEDFDADTIHRTKIYHIHGSIQEPGTLIFGVPEYVSRYNQLRFRDFLSKVFSDYTVLFVGYGLAEFEVLDFVISKINPTLRGELRHFTLQPYYSGEGNLLEFDQSYYNPMGITVLGYQKDVRGYNQLYDVVCDWNKEINQTSVYLPNSYQFLEVAASNFDPTNEAMVLQMIRNDKPQEDHFFHSLASSSNPVPWLEPLYQRGYFKRERNPQPEPAKGQPGYSYLPTWNILGYLENAVKQIQQAPSAETIELLMRVFDEIMDFGDNGRPRTENFRTDWILVKVIAHFPAGAITRRHMDFVSTALTSKWDKTLILDAINKELIPRLLSDNAKDYVLQLLEAVFGTTNMSPLDLYWIDQMLQQSGAGIARLCGLEATNIGLDKLRTLASEDPSRLSGLWVRTLIVEPISPHPEYPDVLLHFVVSMLRFSDANLVREAIGNLWREEHPLFRRIALHALNDHYSDLQDLFGNLMENPLNEMDAHNEVYEILESNAGSFSREEIGRILSWIETAEYYVPEENANDETRRGEIDAYQKRNWLAALQKASDPRVIQLEEKYQAIAPGAISPRSMRPRLISWSALVPEPASPLEQSVILALNNSDLADYICQHAIQPPSRVREDGLLTAFEAAFVKDPRKFVNDLIPFLKVPRNYQAAIVSSMLEAWRAKKDFAWDLLLEFVLTLVGSESFWEGEDEHDSESREWLIGKVVELIQEGTIDDSHAFDAQLMPKAEALLLAIAEKYRPSPNSDDPLRRFVGTLQERIFSALIGVSLRHARLLKDEAGHRWLAATKNVFTKRLDDRADNATGFFVALGSNLGYLAYLDGPWVTENLDKIFPHEDLEKWRAVFIGYLRGLRVNRELYSHLKEKGHYRQALDTGLDFPHAGEIVVQHICLGYLEGWDELGDPNALIRDLIARAETGQLSEIVRYVSEYRSVDSMRLKPLWGKLLEKMSPRQHEIEYQKNIASLGIWSKSIDVIDEEVLEWLKLSARSFSADPEGTHWFVESLVKHTKSTPAKVADIFIELLNQNIYPTLEQDEIQGMVRELYDLGERERADRICILYLSKGLELLRPIYDEHR